MENETQTVVVSGANGGIGTAVVNALLRDGYKVIAIDLSDSNLPKDKSLTFVKCNVTDKDEISVICREITRENPHIYAIVNLVGIFMMESIIEGSMDDLAKIMDVNFVGVARLIKGLFTSLRKGSRIVNMSSEVARHSPQPFMGYYTLSKKMVDSYTDVLRRECNYLGIKVSKIQSGSMKTKLLGNATDQYDSLIGSTEHFKAPLIKFKKLSEGELKKQNDPNRVGKLVSKILKSKHPKIAYRIKNSFVLNLLGILPERIQDKIYGVIK